MSVVTVFAKDGYKDKVFKRVDNAELVAPGKVKITFKNGQVREYQLDKHKYCGNLVITPDNIYNSSVVDKKLIVLMTLLLILSTLHLFV